jgi:NAD(P)-dependent dehydrogenase (short-subunit alcohol dehydrogenase family)
MSVNVWGTHLCTSMVVRVMKEQGRGRIINISSTTAFFGAPRMADYVASKGAIIALSRSLAREYGPFGITVNVIAPGGTWTEASEELFFDGSDQAREPSVIRARQIAEQAVPRQQVPADVTGTACFLLSDDAEMITGQVLIVDGGHVLG